MCVLFNTIQTIQIKKVLFEKRIQAALYVSKYWNDIDHSE